MAQQTAVSKVKETTVEEGGIPADLREKAEANNWSLLFVESILAQGAPPEILHKALDAGMTSLQAMQMMAKNSGAPRELTMDWTRVDTERGIRAKPGKKGLTLDAINIGSYGDVPEMWPDQTMRPRGSWTAPGAVGQGYTIYAKSEVWAENLGSLYEEAIQRRWRPATDIPWDSIEPLPEEIERAIGQICTELCEYNYMIILSLGRWIREISFGFHEAKLFLSTVLFDVGRHYEAFRKRALVNGGGLGVQSTGYRLVPIRDTQNYSEMAIMTFLFHDSVIQSLYLLGAGLAHNEAESRLFSLAAQDKARHLAYGVEHLRYVLEHQPERREEMYKYLEKGEEYLAKDFGADVPMREALAILLGGGLQQIGSGFQKLKDFRRRQILTYLGRIEAAGLGEQRERMWPALAAYLDPAAVPA